MSCRQCMHDVAKWVVHDLGYPIGWLNDEPPPAALREAITDIIYADADGTFHGNELTRREVEVWIWGDR